MAPRLIRRRPLADRIKTYLNPFDFLLWLSEELDSNDWAQWKDEWAIPIGIALNALFLIARANNVQGTRGRGDDVFGDDERHAGWLTWVASFIVHFLTLSSLLNAIYTFWRRRRYRLFENPLDAPPSTPSAHRVRVNSSPVSSSLLRFFSSILAGDRAEARSHPDATKDVWELAVWDPTPFSLRMFCFLSPGHILVYWLFLPTTLQDPRPSMTVITTVLLTGLLSTQLILLQHYCAQQSKDTSIIQKAVLNEYDTKYVHPRTRPQVRDVGTQFSTPQKVMEHFTPYANDERSVDTYSPTVIINKGFHTRPNPNYIKHVDSERQGTPLQGISVDMDSSLETPTQWREKSSPIRQNTAILQANLVGRRTGDGGSLGVYSHAHSPLRKAASTSFSDLRQTGERSISPVKREGSPFKRVSMARGPSKLHWGQVQSNPIRRESGRS